ncbi:hypothetical protein CfE428DRAFT_2699 [Chthoniobacter flavus Ellin428]|uniref:Knr4/Smi1-like domain-containing protein n=1 Tax=Chthoniobacter flavus Ellin428 TaxID=497964 RepID=B4D1B1_9BACT|nr:SMI1/KNR4 family protein [Chthoniobacter flavus]EDY19523.1 hypothetical protein CfE428DRAFT_2699 [Chthoniobacter flavus Ellin428]
MSSPAVTNYVDAAIANLRRHNFMRTPEELPEAMRDPSIEAWDDWVGWKPIESTVTGGDLDALEQETGLAYPPLYREFLQYRHFVNLTEVGVRFEPHLCGEWRDTLRQAYFESWPRERILDAGLIPFGADTFMDPGSVCFDTRRRVADGDCPVVFWDHEWMGTDKEIRPLFSNSRKMFECLERMASADLNFIYHDESEDAALLPRKQELLAQFLAIDPAGAGGEAREYWTGWGVAPMT